MSIKRTYKFAFTLSLFLFLFSIVIVILLSYFLLEEVHFLFAFLTALLIFICSFFIIQFRVERFIYRRVKAIYDDVSLLDLEDLNKKNITSDMETLSKEVKKFAEDKRLEIEMLQIREGYRREFLGTISHELKTPLFTVQGYVLTLLEGAVNDKSIRDKYLERTSKGVERLINIVTDLDMISKLESGNLNLEFTTFDIVKLVENVYDLLEIKAKKRKVVLAYDKEYQTPILVNADIQRIEQVLINLIENSIKYGKKGGQTMLRIKNHSPNQFVVQIIDDGAGIKDEHIARIFERFYRIDQSRSRGQGGSGLGLSIVKHILEAHNQIVFAESIEGQGTTFSFTLEKVE